MKGGSFRNKVVLMVGGGVLYAGLTDMEVGREQCQNKVLKMGGGGGGSLMRGFTGPEYQPSENAT